MFLWNISSNFWIFVVFLFLTLKGYILHACLFFLNAHCCISMTSSGLVFSAAGDATKEVSPVNGATPEPSKASQDMLQVSVLPSLSVDFIRIIHMGIIFQRSPQSYRFTHTFLTGERTKQRSSESWSRGRTWSSRVGGCCYARPNGSETCFGKVRWLN